VRTTLAMLLVCLAACDDTVGGQKPVGGTVDTEAQIQRFLRRAYLDLSGKVPTDDQLTTSTTRLRDAQNTPTARAALVDELIAQDTFPKVWIEELENGIFGGNTLDQQYAFVCAIVRGSPDCLSCTEGDSCLCTCPSMLQFNAERTDLRKTSADFASGAKTSALERRYAKAAGYYVLAGSPEGRVRTLFDDFLSRPAEPDEIENGRGMILGSLVPGAPAGLMFHRHGTSYTDLLDIVFTSEVYREAMVRRAFERYLARTPSSPELGYFVSTLSATEPDARPLIRAVVSSREYFAQ
jgi:hypothetical protein